MRTIRKVAFYFGVVNLIIGIAGFTGPLVTGNDDRIINIQPGKLFGLFAINWLHALLHLITGIAGILVRGSSQASQIFMGVSGAVYGGISGAGWASFGFKPGIYKIMGMALNWPDNILHTLWSVVGLVFGTKPDLLKEDLPELVEIEVTVVEQVEEEPGVSLPIV